MPNKYDAFLFGNGLTINLLHQLKEYIPKEKHYLLSIDSFLKEYISDSLNTQEQNKINILFRGKSAAETYSINKKLRNELSKFYDTGNGNIEYRFGVGLFIKNKLDYSYDLIQSIFPVLYNIWFNVLYNYLEYSKLVIKISLFNKSIVEILDRPKFITTNFDLFFDELNPDYIHGKFIKNIKKYSDIILEYNDESMNTYNFKTCWGHSGIGKGENLYKYFLKHKYTDFFDFDFLFNPNISFDNILIYGMSFHKAGYLKDMEKFDNKYSRPQIGGVIDEHILFRLSALQKKNQLTNITFAFYNETTDLEHYKNLLNLYNLENVQFINASEFDFHC